MNKRDMIKVIGAAWLVPVVESVSLPAHAQTSPIIDPRGGNGDPPPPPDDCLPGDDCYVDPQCPDGDCPPDDPPVEPEPSACSARELREGKVEVCHREPRKDPVEICVAQPAVPAHLRLHGDTLGKCD